jgi:hypothetical protein
MLLLRIDHLLRMNQIMERENQILLDFWIR